MHGYDFHDALYQSCEIMAPGSGFQGLVQDQYGHIGKIYYILQNLILYSNLHLRKK